jgi:hypothetical protein
VGPSQRLGFEVVDELRRLERHEIRMRYVEATPFLGMTLATQPLL